MVRRKNAHLEGRDKATRQQQRRVLGPLRNLTAQPAPRERYDRALERFRQFLKEENRQFPCDPGPLDHWLSHYIETLWESGEGRALAADTIASVQDHLPSVKGRLAASWRLMKTWATNEIPNRAPPLPLEALEMMIGQSLFQNDDLFALSLLLAFHGLLRTGEVLGVHKAHCQQAGPRSVAVISLGMTKGGKRQGAAESITIREEDLLRRLWQWKSTPHARSMLCEAPHTWRKKFSACLDACGLGDYQFRPYSLRRGGATCYFSRYGSLDRLLLLGRWQAAKTARVYINEGLATLAELRLQGNSQAQAYRRQYIRSKSVELQPLERARKGRPGDNGKSKKSRKSGRKKGKK